MLQERDRQILHVLYRQKNITKTAQELFMSQPSLTKRLSQIEKEFGVEIVQRGRRGVHFTAQGEYLAKCAEETLFNFRKYKENVRNMNNKVAGVLRLGVSNYFTKYKLPGLLKNFKSKFPEVEFQVSTGWSREVYKLVYNQEVHIGFVRGEYNWPHGRHLLFEESLCVASMNPIIPEDLPNYPRIDYQTENVFKALIDNWWIENYSQPPLIGMVVDKVDTCREMVINGLGYAIVPRLIVSDVEDVHTFDLLDNAGKPITRKTWMFYHMESLEMNVVRAFVEFIHSSEAALQLK